jgi:transketolase
VIFSKIATQIRIEIIKMIAQAGSGHPAGSLGMADIFTVLYLDILNHRPKNPSWSKRDYLILSNGHICPVLYATLAKTGYFSASELKTLRKKGSKLQGHPHFGSLLGVENSSGPLGQGISQACGLALSLKMDHKDNHVFCVMSDGEQQEGQTWEAYQLAAKYNLNNLTAIVDRNFIQIEGSTEKVMPLDPLTNKIKSFGWEVMEMNGHDFGQITVRLQNSKKSNRPTAIIAHTTPGKGVSFMENKSKWHGKAPNEQQTQLALEQLEAQL